MKAFWWFKDQQVAGMARPGFNCTPWLTMPYEEGVLMALLGQYSNGAVPMEKLHEHMEHYSPKAIPFYGLSDDEVVRLHAKMTSVDGLNEILSTVRKKTQIIDRFDVDQDQIEIHFCKNRLNEEIAILKDRNIDAVVALTEDHHNTDELSDHFELRHLSIRDLSAPTIEQAEELAQYLQKNRSEGKTTAVHCLAGIGRTSTMLMAAHVLLGEKFSELKDQLAIRNPYYKFTGSQSDFLNQVIDQAGQ